MKEIGSEFWSVPTTEYRNGLFQDSTQWFLSGRSALQSIIKDLNGCKTIGLPSWCCDSMIKPFVDAGFDVEFYPVLWNEELTQSINNGYDVILVMDYFGYSSLSALPKQLNGVIIRDVTHSIFSESYEDADYYFGSLRKWCGVWTGGFVWTKDGHQLPVDISNSEDYIKLREQAMNQKEQFIAAQNSNCNSNKRYLELYQEAENLLEKVGAEPATDRDIELANCLDSYIIKGQRRANAKVLMSAFKEWLFFPELGNNDCPMFVPIIVPNGKRNELRQYLIEREIYCPVHWPISDYHVLDEEEQFIYDNELSLVCDQRYDENDMLRIVDAVNDFWKDAC